MDAKLQAAIDLALSDPNISPPEEYKRGEILRYAKQYNCNLFVETGTNKGDTLEAVRDYFGYSYSIELGPELYRQAQKRFDTGVQLLLGDGGEILQKLIPKINGEYKILFYLDAHSRYDETSPKGYGIGTSAPRELEVIAELRPSSVVLIDDARLFTHQFNTTWPRLDAFIEDIERYGFWNIELEKDIIRLVPWDFIK